MHSRFNKYQIMWILVFFDLPTDSKAARKRYSNFRKKLLDDGFSMFQFSIYIRHCSSRENMEVHVKRILGFLPPKGHVGMLTITDKQFGDMKVFYGKTPKEKINMPQQLELF